MRRTFLRILLGLFVSLVTFGFAPEARAGWTHEVTYAYSSGNTSLKVTDPKNFKVSVKVSGNEVEKTIPAIFTLPKKDDYLWVKVTAKDGKIWKEKIEIKARKQAILKVNYTAAKGKPKPKSAGKALRKYIGKVVNSSQYCKKSQNGTMRFDFMKQGNKKYSFTVDAGKTKNNLDIEEGQYEIRVFLKGNFFKTFKQTISKDGWKVSFGCPKPKKVKRRRRRR